MADAQKSKHPGGRPKGSRNKATLEREARAAEAMLEDVRGGKVKPEKLGRTVLHDFMETFAGLAALHQPLPDGVPVPRGRHPDEAKFEKWARLAVETAARLAPYQSPTFKAIAVVAPPPQDRPQAPDREDNVIHINDPARLARVYQSMLAASGGR